jgi:hypothetical protein
MMSAPPPPRWPLLLAAGALAGGAASLLDAWSQVAEPQWVVARRGACSLAVAVALLLTAAPGAVAHLRTGTRDRRRWAVVVGFVTFDAFAAVGAWRWHRGILVPLRFELVVATGICAATLLVVSLRSVGEHRARQDRGRHEWG